jgi:NTP pyrophosphatase (non-canonical NTP hydrolase)
MMDLTTDEVLSFEQLRANVQQWAADRGIYTHSTLHAQVLKAVSEMGELADAAIKGDPCALEDAIGDVVVCLINAAVMAEVEPEVCFARAWNEIKDRRGRMVAGGAFVKEPTQ